MNVSVKDERSSLHLLICILLLAHFWTIITEFESIIFILSNNKHEITTHEMLHQEEESDRI